MQGNKLKLVRLLKKNDVYPNTSEKIFTITVDYQESVKLNVFEGEIEEDSSKNEFYGSLQLDGIERGKIGVPKIKVRFDFDKNRVLTVTAENMKTGSIKKVQIKKGIKK